jgi:chaperonin GroES
MYKVMGARVVIKREEAKSETKSGIILSEKTATEQRARQGVVIAVGDGAWLDSGVKLPMTLKIGDEVLYRDFSGYELDPDHFVINEGDVIAILERGEENGSL